MGKYVLNKETQKIELYFDRAEYLALSDSQKAEVKSAFLWSRNTGAWVSRSTKSHYRPLKVAEMLGLENDGSKGERLSYAEELGLKSERAEARAERFEEYAENAEARAEQLQSALKGHRGDIAFFTQPIIAGHAGSRAFANYREKLYRRYHKGFEEYEKSSYYRDRAATARATANNKQLNDRSYLANRIKEQNKKIKDYQGYIATAENNLYRIQQGEQLKNRYTGEAITAESLESRITELLEKYEYEHGKLEFFEKYLEDIGGIQYSKDNIKVGFTVEVRHPGRNCEVLAAGPANITYKILDGGAKGMVLTSPYAEILSIIKAVEKSYEVENPYKIGDILCKYRSGDRSIYEAYQVVRVTKTGVRLQRIEVEDGKPVKGNFIRPEQVHRKVSKSKYSDFVGVYMDNRQLHKYELKTT